MWACGTKKEETKTEVTPLSVSVVEVSEHSFTENLSSSGLLTSKSEVKLAFKTGGLIKKSYVKEGDYVKAGQLLAELDLSEIQSQVNQAEIGFAKAQRDLERVQKLFKDEAATQTNLQDAQSGLEMAKQTRDAAQFNLKLSRIYAPSAGRILRKISEQGELIAPFNPMFLLGTGNEAYVVKLGLTDRDIVKVSLGDPAHVELDAYPGEIFGGRVSQIAQTINPATGTYEIEVEITPNGKRLIAGFVAKVGVGTRNTSKNLVVPVESLVNAQGNQADVYVLEGNKVRKREVDLGKIQGGGVAVLSGLSVGEKVVTRGSGFVSDGDLVNVSNL